jgi:hypothetical protein
MALLVALVQRPKNLEAAISVLVTQANFAPAEARMRLAPEPPAVLQRLDPPAALSLVTSLKKVGAAALAVDPEAAEAPMVARSFELGPSQATFFARDGAETEVGYGDVRLILRGLRVTSGVNVRTEIERKFSLGNALLTQGLKMTKTEKKEIRSEVTTPFHAALVYGPWGSVLLDEAELVYQSLGEALKPSRLENLNTLVGELRKRAATAIYDDRLLRLGPRPLALGTGDPFLVVAEILNQAQLAGLV